MLTVTFVKDNVSNDHPLSEDWEVEVKHVFHESNRVADFLTRFGHSCTLGLHVLDGPPLGCGSLVVDDLVVFLNAIYYCSLGALALP